MSVGVKEQQRLLGAGAELYFAGQRRQRRGHERRPPGGHLRWGGRSTAPGRHQNVCRGNATPGMTICRQATRSLGSRTQLVSTFEASRSEHGSTTTCGLPGTETVLACSLKIVWLERTLRHSKFSFKSPDRDDASTEGTMGPTAEPGVDQSDKASGPTPEKCEETVTSQGGDYGDRLNRVVCRLDAVGATNNTRFPQAEVRPPTPAATVHKLEDLV